MATKVSISVELEPLLEVVIYKASDDTVWMSCNGKTPFFVSEDSYKVVDEIAFCIEDELRPKPKPKAKPKAKR